MWCSVENCFHNLGGCCEDPGHVCINAEGKCDMCHIVEKKQEEEIEDEEDE